MAAILARWRKLTCPEHVNGKIYCWSTYEAPDWKRTQKQVIIGRVFSSIITAFICQTNGPFNMETRLAYIQQTNDMEVILKGTEDIKNYSVVSCVDEWG